MKLDELVRAIAAKEQWKVESKGAEFTLTVPVSAGRMQSVMVSEFKDQGAAHVRFTTTVGPADRLDPARCRSALSLNARLPQGCLALDGDRLVLTETRPLGTTTPATSGAAILSIARQADIYEGAIYKTDAN